MQTSTDQRKLANGFRIEIFTQSQRWGKRTFIHSFTYRWHDAAAESFQSPSCGVHKLRVNWCRTNERLRPAKSHLNRGWWIEIQNPLLIDASQLWWDDVESAWAVASKNSIQFYSLPHPLRTVAAAAAAGGASLSWRFIKFIKFYRHDTTIKRQPTFIYIFMHLLNPKLNYFYLEDINARHNRLKFSADEERSNNKIF